ncbi:MAG TPA: hypothetical protein VHE30_14450 [Polyangiaceae bacterium]|nr:hypothetical protein [Polyangiaceae bacterium]
MIECRRRIPWRALVVSFVLGFSGVAFGAPSEKPTAEAREGFRGHFALHAVTAEPFGTGSHALDRWGYGLGFSLGAGYGRIPVTLGVDFVGVAWGSGGTNDPVLLNGSPVAAEITRRDRAIFYDLWLRVEPPFFSVRPYVEGVLGVKGLYTVSSLRLIGGEGETRATTPEEPASTIGFGLGLDVLFARNATGAAAYASLGFRRLHGGRAAFSGAFESGETAHFETSTDTTLVLAGITARWTP